MAGVDPDRVRTLARSIHRGVAGERDAETLAGMVARDLDGVLDALQGIVEGASPDTVVATRSVVVVLAALAARRDGGRLRLLLPDRPVPGWGPLKGLADVLAAAGYADVYPVPLLPDARRTALTVARKVGRVARGIGARLVDVTDAPAPAVAGLYGGGVRLLTFLVEAGGRLVFQRFTYT